MIRLVLLLFFLAGGGFYFGIFSSQNETVVKKEQSVEEVLIEAIVAKKIMTQDQINTQVVGRFDQLKQQVNDYYSDLARQRKESLDDLLVSKQHELKGQKVRLNDCRSSCQFLEDSVAKIEGEISGLKSELAKDLELLDANRDEKLSEIQSDYMSKLNELVLKVKDES